MSDPQFAIDYDDRGVAAAHSVLVEIGQILGSFRDCFVVIGGAVPTLTFPNAEEKHVGTVDVDLGLDPDALSEGEYAGFVDALEARGYIRGQDDMKRFQLRKEVTLGIGPPIAVIVDLLMPREAAPKKNRPPLVKDFAVQKGDGVGLALKNCFVAQVSGIMPDGRRNVVHLRVASIPAFLVMKGYALVGRDKQKDAYDIYYSIRHFPGGIGALIAKCRELLEDRKAKEAYQNIATKFGTRDDFGPNTVRMFLSGQEGVDEAELDQIQTDAYFQVSEWWRGTLS